MALMSLLYYVPIATLISGIVIALILHIPLAIALAVTILVTFFVAKGFGYSLDQQMIFGLQGIKQTKPVLYILSLVGVLIPLLMMSGTIPGMIYYGLEVVNVTYILVIGFILTSVVSYLLGTSVGTLSTIGLSLIGIAHASQIPLGMMAGALISGAMVGERFSPVSSSRLLAISSIEGDESRIHTLARKTGWIAFGMTTLVFLLLDIVRSNGAESKIIEDYQHLLITHFPITFLSMVPLVAIISAFLFRLKAIPSLFIGISASFVLLVLQRPIGIHDFVTSMFLGFDLQSGTALDELVHGGGMIPILQVLLLISLAGFLNGILQNANLLKPIVDKVMGRTDKVSALVIKSVVLSLLVIIISCNQTIPLLVLGNTLYNRFANFPNGKDLLGRTLLDATLVMPVLVPWNGLAMVMSVTLGVKTMDALPFLLFPLLLPIVTIFFSYIDLPHKKGQIMSPNGKVS